MTRSASLILIILLAFSFAAAKTVTKSQFENQVFELTNQERAKHGLQPLIKEDGLAALARRHGEDMARYNYFRHEDREGMTVGGRQKKYYKELTVLTIGENLAYFENSERVFSAAKIVRGWMNSPGHRANILSGEYTHLGLAVALTGDKLYVVQNFCCPVVKLCSKLPSYFKQNYSYELMFEYLNWQNANSLEAFLVLPNPKTKVPIGNRHYMEGVLPLTVTWDRGSRLKVKLPFSYGKGRYKLAFGWGNGFYESDYSFTVR
ncbi:MAG: CAP domain-containing protein [Candidatus Cloacimonadaceae bacterium]